MKLEIVPPSFIDLAWKDGADCLAEACELIDDITGSQLKMILSRGERNLVRMSENGQTVGWGTFRIDQLPNVRVLHITDLVAHNAGFERFFEELKTVARQAGCSQVRCSAPKAQARLYRMKCGFSEVYTTMKVDL